MKHVSREVVIAREPVSRIAVAPHSPGLAKGFEMRRTRKRTIGPTLMGIATAFLMAACSPSGSQAGTQAAAATQPAASQTSTTTASTSQKFVSNRYGFDVTMTSDWSEVDALIDWGGKEIHGPGAPDFANIADPARGRTLMAAAAPVPPGTQLADWSAAMVRGTPPVCPEPSSTEATTLGGEPALAWTLKCSDGLDVNKLAVLHGQRGYVIYLASATANDDAEDHRIFEGIRQSFHFTS